MKFTGLPCRNLLPVSGCIFLSPCVLPPIFTFPTGGVNEIAGYFESIISRDGMPVFNHMANAS